MLGMRTAILLILIMMVMMAAGCIGQQAQTGGVPETVQGSGTMDIDQDGRSDIWRYAFDSHPLEGTGYQAQRMLLAHTETDIRYGNFRNLTDFQALQLAEAFNQFESSAQRSVMACRKEIGLSGVNCPNARTCAQLCASNSLRCRKLADENEEAVGGSVLRYGQQANELQEALGSSGRMLNMMAGGERIDREQLAEKLETALNTIYALEASPLVQMEEMRLCSAGSYEMSGFRKVVNGIGNATMEPRAYRYSMLLKVTPSPASTVPRTTSITNVRVTDRLPAEWVAENDVASALPFAIGTNRSGVFITFDPLPPAAAVSRWLSYSFASATLPDTLLTRLGSPGTQAQVIDLQLLGPSAALFDILKVTNDPYVALGVALAMPLIILLALMAIGTLGIPMALSRWKKESTGTALRKALLRTPVRWKTDLVTGLIAIGAGTAVSVLFAPRLAPGLDIFSVAQQVTRDPLSFVASAGVFFGSLLVYEALENRIRVHLLEQVYGKELRDDRETYNAAIGQLTERWQQLRDMAEKASKEYVDVSKEYNVIAELSPERIGGMRQRFDETSRQSLREHLIRVEDALERLQEKRHAADTSWNQWKQLILKLLEENETVHRSQLVGIPGPLQVWALHRFAEENAGQEIAFQGESIARHRISPELATGSLFEKGILQTLVVTRNDKVVLMKAGQGSAAVAGALALKLLGYVKSAARHMGYGSYGSLASVGSREILLISREHGLETIMLVPREKFREALEGWKEKGKKLATAGQG